MVVLNYKGRKLNYLKCIFCSVSKYYLTALKYN